MARLHRSVSGHNGEARHPRHGPYHHPVQGYTQSRWPHSERPLRGSPCSVSWSCRQTLPAARQTTAGDAPPVGARGTPAGRRIEGAVSGGASGWLRLGASSPPIACDSTAFPAARARPPPLPAWSCWAGSCGPSGRSPQSSHRPPADSCCRPWLDSGNPGNPVPLGASRVVPPFSLKAVKRNFLFV